MRCQSWHSGDGHCDEACNTELCNYDGGDCETNGEKVMELLSSLIPVKSGESVATPATCSYGNYQEKGTCFMKYTGLESLLGTSLDLAVDIHRCADPEMSEAFPAVAFGMTGSFIETIKNPTPCSVDSDCSGLGSKLQCHDFGSLLGQGEQPTDYSTGRMSSNCSRQCQNWNGDDYCDNECNNEACNHDGGDCKSDGEKLKDSIHEILKGVLYKDSADTKRCMADDVLFKHIRSLVLALAGKPKDDSSSLKFCTPDIGQAGEDIDAWAEEAKMKKDGNIWTMPFLVNGETLQQTIPTKMPTTEAPTTRQMPAFTYELQQKLAARIEAARVVASSEVLAKTLPPSTAPTPFPTPKGKEIVMEEQDVTFVETEMQFAMSTAEAKSPVMIQVLEEGVAASIGADPSKVKVISVGGEAIRRLAEGTSVGFEIQSNDPESAKTLETDIQAAATGGSIVQHVKAKAADKGVLTADLKSMPTAMKSPVTKMTTKKAFVPVEKETKKAPVPVEKEKKMPSPSSQDMCGTGCIAGVAAAAVVLVGVAMYCMMCKKRTPEHLPVPQEPVKHGGVEEKLTQF